MLRRLKILDRQLDKEAPLLILLLLLVVLRIPNLLEPYWYGDEGIYLTLGVAMRNGARLYAEIIDHKTPLIYYLAMVPNQLWFRILNIGWMVATTIAFYHIAWKLFKQVLPTTLAAGIFVLLTTLPWFEGNIPNGELFVMGFMLWGGLLLFHTKLFTDFFTNPTKKKQKSSWFSHPLQQLLSRVLNNTHDTTLYLAAGVALGLGILTKVPAVLDAAVFFGVSWFTTTNSFLSDSIGTWLKRFVVTVLRSSIVAVGIVLPILASILYFIARGSGQAYLDFGLLYNFRYVQAWQLPFDNQLLATAFSLPGKAAIAGGIVVAVTVFRKWLSPVAQFVITWFALSLFATLLSNRPYPHYFIQLMPALSLLVVLLLQHGSNLVKGFNILGTFGEYAKHFSSTFSSLLVTTLSAGLLAMFVSILFLLDVGLYPTLSYYTRSMAYAKGELSREEYYQGFDSLMRDNYAAAEIIAQSDDPYLFIWGTNPMLYALTQKAPTGRFTVSFHIKDFDAYQETFDDLVKRSPMFIVVMKDETTPLPGLPEYLEDNYVVNGNFDRFYLWKQL